MFGKATTPVPELVLQKFVINEYPAPGEPYLDISGRSAGLIAWVLNKISLDPTNNFQLYENEIRIRTSSIAGVTISTISLDSISSASCGFEKPIQLLILAALTICCGIGLIFFFQYKTRKALRLSVETAGGSTFEMKFMRSLIEKINVEMDDAIRVIDILNKRIAAAHGTRTEQSHDSSSVAPRALAAPATPPPPPPPPSKS